MNWSKEFTIRKPRNKQKFLVSGLLVYPRDRFREEEFQRSLLSVFTDDEVLSRAGEEGKQEKLARLGKKLRDGDYFGSRFKPSRTKFPYNDLLTIAYVHFPKDEILMYIGGENHHKDEGPLPMLSRAGYQGVLFHLDEEGFDPWSSGHLQWLTAWFKDAVKRTDAVFGCLDHSDELLGVEAKERDPFKYIYGLTCLNKETVEKIDGEKFMSAWFHSIEFFSEEHTLFQLSENPAATIEKTKRQKRIYNLGLGPAPEEKETSTGKAPDLPGWLTGASLPDGVEVPDEQTVQVIVGLRADELHLTGLDVDESFFEYFVENVLEQMNCEERTEFAFRSWFNGTGTGLEAFAGGSKAGDEELDVFVGKLVGTLTGKRFSSEFEFKKIRETMTKTRKKFGELGFREEPKLTFILLWWFG